MVGGLVGGLACVIASNHLIAAAKVPLLQSVMTALVAVIFDGLIFPSLR